MKTKNLNLDPFKDFLHNHTYNNGLHIEELSALFRKIAIEYSILSLFRFEEEAIISKNMQDHLYILGCFADALDEIYENYKSNK